MAKKAEETKKKPGRPKLTEAQKRQRRLRAEEKKAEKLAKDVQAALEEAGYEFPSFLSNEYRQEFIQSRGYNPSRVLSETLQLAEADKDWKSKIVLPPNSPAEKGPGGGGPSGLGQA